MDRPRMKREFGDLRGERIGSNSGDRGVRGASVEEEDNVSTGQTPIPVFETTASLDPSVKLKWEILETQGWIQ